MVFDDFYVFWGSRLALSTAIFPRGLRKSTNNFMHYDQSMLGIAVDFGAALKELQPDVHGPRFGPMARTVDRPTLIKIAIESTLGREFALKST